MYLYTAIRYFLSDIEQTLNRIKTHKGVQGVVIVNNKGVPIRSTFPPDQTLSFADNITQLATKARDVVREINNTEELTFLRVRTNQCEYMIAPEKDYILIVVQDPNAVQPAN